MSGGRALRLAELINGDHAAVTNHTAMGDTNITGLTCDSRRVEPGFLFAALPGTQADGRDFIRQAVTRGAAAVLAPPGTRLAKSDRKTVLVADENSRRRFALMAARFYGRQPGTVAAITGTNGKTSVAHFLRQIWTAKGFKAASLGTLGVVAPGRKNAMKLAGGLTSPDPVSLHAILGEMARDGITCLALEASSHGLAQFRLDGVRITAAAYTNLSRDHLDYHGTMEEYLAAKLRLFSDLLSTDGTAVINADADHAGQVENAATGKRILTHGARGRDIRVDRIETLAHGQRLDVTVFGKAHQLVLPLVGGFQVGNALSALALALVSGVDEETAIAALKTLEGAPGRVQFIARRDDGAAAYVDYAHTPDALVSVLTALRPHAAGRLHVVFGCGGDRDQGKRPEMGRIAAENADVVIVTDDNPRGEDAAAIRRQILAACPGAREIGDRADAIHAAAAGLEAGDLLVVAGKGHEQGQIIGDRVRPFDDGETVAAAMMAGAS